MPDYYKVYLLHFNKKIGNLSNKRAQAQHYLGCTKNLEERLELHRKGISNVNIIDYLHKKGIGFEVVQWGYGGFEIEKQIKASHDLGRYCVYCSWPKPAKQFPRKKRNAKRNKRTS